MSIKAMIHVWDNSKQEGTNLLMMLALADMADEATATCYPGVNKLAKRARTGERNAKIILRQLEEAGEIVIQEGKGIKTSHGWTNRYQIIMPGIERIEPYKRPRPQKKAKDPEGVNPSSPHEDQIGGNSGSPQDMQSDSPQGGNPGSPDPKGDPKEETKESTTPPDGDAVGRKDNSKKPSSPKVKEPTLRDQLFALIAKESFGIEDVTLLRQSDEDDKKSKRRKRDTGALIGEIVSWLIKLPTPVTEEEVQRFYVYYTNAKPGISRPKQFAVFESNFLAFRPIFARRKAQEQAQKQEQGKVQSERDQKPNDSGSRPAPPDLFSFVTTNLPPSPSQHSSDNLPVAGV